MNETISKENLLFYITKSTIQQEAMNKMGRELNEEEIEVAKKGLEWGLLSSIDVVYNTIFTEMIKKR